MDRNTITVSPTGALNAKLRIPGDKSISHRSLIISSLSDGLCVVENLLMSEDCLHTLNALRTLGVSIKKTGETTFEVTGRGIDGLCAPKHELDMGNSGTGMRLMAGVLASCKFTSTLTGDESLSNRPMKRIIDPLGLMGARIDARDGTYPPLTVHGRQLKPITYNLPVASAQVKSAILLAGLNCTGETVVIEPAKARDHTEKMLAYFGADISVLDRTITLRGGRKLQARDIVVPGDISSAAFFIVAAAAKPESRVILRDVGLNPTRNGILSILQKMGARISINPSAHSQAGWDEPRGDIVVYGSTLHGITIEGDDIPNVIDEIPILAVAGALADGRTVIKDAQELRVKESDRIKTMVTNLSLLGVKVQERDDGMIIDGGNPLSGAVVDSFGDHRVAMSMAVAGLFLCDGGSVTVQDTQNINTSFPDFNIFLDKLVNG